MAASSAWGAMMRWTPSTYPNALATASGVGNGNGASRAATIGIGDFGPKLKLRLLIFNRWITLAGRWP
jgi:hypothetical protein